MQIRQASLTLVHIAALVLLLLRRPQPLAQRVVAARAGFGQAMQTGGNCNLTLPQATAQHMHAVQVAPTVVGIRMTWTTRYDLPA